MQFSAAMILLHRPLAQFGKDGEMQSSGSEMSRQICIDNACSITRYLQEYHAEHGSVSTMSWIALHIIATASTTLIANVAERKATADLDAQLGCLRSCLDALSELEKSHVVTRRVRKVIQHAIRLLNLDATINLAGSVRQFTTLATPQSFAASAMTTAATGATGTGTAATGTGTGTATATGLEMQTMTFLDLLPAGSQFDGLNSFESYFS